MGLAPYGEPRYADRILDELIDLRDDGSFRMNMRYFDYLRGLTMTNARFDAAVRRPAARARERRSPSARWTWPRSIQEVTEEIVLRHGPPRRARSPASATLCLAGGVALNCVANGRLLREGPFERHLDPAGRRRRRRRARRGAATAGTRSPTSRARASDGATDGMSGALPRPGFSDDEIGRYLRRARLPAHELIDDQRRWAARDRRAGRRRQGRRAVPGPDGVRAARARRTARSSATRARRDAVGDEPEDQVPRVVPPVRAGGAGASAPPSTSTSTSSRPYMLLVAPVAASELPARRRPPARGRPARAGSTRCARSIPAVTHVDYSARAPDRRRASRARSSTRILSAFDDADRLPGAGQHLVQRARRADRLHARGRLPLLHAHRDGPPRPGRPRARQGEPSRRGPRTRRWRRTTCSTERLLPAAEQEAHVRPAVAGDDAGLRPCVPTTSRRARSALSSVAGSSSWKPTSVSARLCCLPMSGRTRFGRPAATSRLPT